jgi:hypothetical protein
MSKYYGDFLVSKTVRCRFNTVNSSGVPTSLSSGAVTVTKDGSDVTPSGGVTLTVDVGSLTGRNHVTIDMSVDTTTFTAGSEYSVRLSGSSAVGSTSVVGIVVGEWSVENRSVTVDSSGRIQIQSGTGTGQISIASGVVAANTTQVAGQTASASGAVTFPGSIMPSGNVTVGAYATGEDPATLLFSSPANKLATDSSGRVLLQPTQTGVTIPTVTNISSTVAANVMQWGSNAVPTTNVNGVPLVDIGYVRGTTAAISNGTAQAATGTSITLASTEPSAANFYVGRQVTIVAGTASGQARFVTAYNGSTKVATVHRAWDVIPDATSQYTIDSLIETDAYQFAGQNVVLDANNLPSVNAKDWNGAAISTSVPNTASVTVTAISAGIAAADVWGAARTSYTAAGTFGQAVTATVPGNVTVGGYASGQDPGTYILVTAANKLATDTTGRVLLQPTQNGVTIPTVTAVTTANLNLSQAVPTSNTAQTVGDALNAARAQGFGKWQLVGTTLTLYAPDGTTPVRTFSLDSVSAPTIRT